VYLKISLPSLEDSVDLEFVLKKGKFLKQKLFKKLNNRGQSFVELALIIPILLLMLLGVVEVAVFIGRYLDVLDLTREAARFASVRDPFSSTGDINCSTADGLNFYYDSSCILSPPTGSSACANNAYCNGFNPYVVLNPDTDDVVISVFTVLNQGVTDNYPRPNSTWALSNVYLDAADPAFNVDYNFTATDPHQRNNYFKNCQGDDVRTEPYYTNARVTSDLVQFPTPSDGSAPSNGRGFVAVEVFYCYEQVLGLPLFSDIIPNPMQIHAYTLMPLPAAQPTPTPVP